MRCGCSSGLAASWLRISGEALHSSQRSPSLLMAMDDWVRELAEMLPARKPRQREQLQFHWGKPPPAAAPRTSTCMQDSGNKPTTAGTRQGTSRSMLLHDVR